MRKRWQKQLIGSAVLALAAGSASAATLYSNDFESALGLSGAGGITGAQSFTGIGGIAGNIWRNNSTGNPAASSNLSLSGIGAHTGLQIEFDFLAIDSWDGSTGTGGIIPPDYFNVSVDSGSEFKETVDFAMVSDGSISTSADATLLARGSNYGFSGWPDTVYHITLNVLGHSASTVDIKFFASGNGWQGGSDESWGIDNLTISTATSVPEPNSLLLLAGGLLAAGVFSRRRKAIV